MGLLPEGKARKLKQKALFDLGMIFGAIGGFLGLYWAEKMPWWQRVIWMVVILAVVVAACYGVSLWVDSI